MWRAGGWRTNSPSSVVSRCAPLKVLLADRVIVVAQAAGASLLGDPKWSAEFARATSAALAKPVVRVDIPSMTVSY